MFTHPELLSALARERTNDMIETATKYRLLAAIRRNSRRRPPASQRLAAGTEPSRNAGRLVGCELNAVRAR
jgi:hypothetical protein